MRLLICAGGTGGGVYPALTVLRALGNEADPVLWVGGVGGMEADLVKRANISFRAIPAAGVHGVGARSLPRNIGQLAKGVLASRRILSEFRPEVLFFTGGYVAIPMAVAGYKLPSLVYVPDIEPGLALKFLLRFADRVALSTDASLGYMPNRSKAVVTGYPTRPELALWTRETGCRALDIRADQPVLLVAGGSRGARSLNRALMAALPQLLDRTQVVHITGELDWSEVDNHRMALSKPHLARYRVYPYMHEIGAALAAADLVVSRAGASILGEYPLFGIPAVLVPYPHAWRYQKVNAGYLAQKGAAVVLEDSDLPDQFLPTVQSLLSQTDRLKNMSAAMKALARPDAGTSIANQICSLASDSRGGKI